MALPSTWQLSLRDAEKARHLRPGRLPQTELHCVQLGWVTSSAGLICTHTFQLCGSGCWALFLFKLNFLASDGLSGSLCVQFLCTFTYAFQVTLLRLIIGNEVLSLTEHRLLVKIHECTKQACLCHWSPSSNAYGSDNDFFFKSIQSNMLLT